MRHLKRDLNFIINNCPELQSTEMFTTGETYQGPGDAALKKKKTHHMDVRFEVYHSGIKMKSSGM